MKTFVNASVNVMQCESQISSDGVIRAQYHTLTVCVCVCVCVCVSIRSPVSHWTSRALRTYDFWFYTGQQMVSLWKKTHKPSDRSAAASWLLISLLLLANVHFQHTAELVKLLSVINVNYRLQVRPLDQGWGTLILEGHSPAEFSSNPEKPWGKNTQLDREDLD